MGYPKREVITPLSGTVCRPSAGTSYDQPVDQVGIASPQAAG